MKRIVYLLIFLSAFISAKIKADGCSGAASFTVTYDPVNNCYFFTNTTNNDCGFSGICIWDFGDGTIVTTVQGANTVCHTYACNNTYIVSLVYDATNCFPGAICNGSQPIVVNTGPVISTAFSGNNSACVGAPAFPIQLNVSVSNGSNLSPYTVYASLNGTQLPAIPAPTGTATINFNPTTAGVYTYTIDSSVTATQNVCPTSSTSSFVVTVYDYPVAALSNSDTVCQDDPSTFVTFYGSGNLPPYTFTYTVNNGSPQTISTTGSNTSVSIPVNTAIPGNYVFDLISVVGSSPSICQTLSSTSTSITVIPKPAAIISGNYTVCTNDPFPTIQFSGSNSIAPYQFTYSINSSQNLTISTIGSSSSVGVAAPTLVPGTYTYILLEVLSSSSPACSSAAFGTAVVQVIDPPDATISGGGAYCQNSPSPNITFVGNGFNPPYTFTYTVNGGPVQTIISSNGNSVNLQVPTNVVGTFVYDLLNIQSGVLPFCDRPVNLSQTVIIRPLPTATISPPQRICQGTGSVPVVINTFGGVPPYELLYTFNGSSPITINTNTNSATISCPIDVSGVFTYNLLTITDGGTPACSTNPNLLTTVEVIDLPTASITGSTSVCQNSTAPQLTISCSGNNPPYQVLYSMNNVVAPPLNIGLNSATISVPTVNSGIYSYSLIGVSGGSNPVCSSPLNSTAVVNINPQPDAEITGNSRVCINGPSPEVVLSGFNANDPYVFDYTLNGLPFQAQSINGTCVLTAPTNVAGSFVYSLIGVSSGNNPVCYRAKQEDVIITIDPNPVIDFESVPIPCEYSTLIGFENLTSGAVAYEWDFGNGFSSNNPTPEIDYYVSGTYLVQLVAVSDFGCIDSLEKTLDVKDGFAIWIPNAFTPNQDNINESFYPVTMSSSEVRFSIFDRWGLLVYESTSPNKGWNGMVGGRPAQEGAYVYMINAIDNCGKLHSRKGTFFLVR